MTVQIANAEEITQLRKEVVRLRSLHGTALCERDEARAEVTRLRAVLEDCQYERTRNADAAARSINELAQ